MVFSQREARSLYSRQVHMLQYIQALEIIFICLNAHLKCNSDENSTFKFIKNHIR